MKHKLKAGPHVGLCGFNNTNNIKTTNKTKLLYILGYMSHFLYLEIGSNIDCVVYTGNATRECIIY